MTADFDDSLIKRAVLKWLVHTFNQSITLFCFLIAQFQRRDCKTSVEKADASIQHWSYNNAFETEQLGFVNLIDQFLNPTSTGGSLHTLGGLWVSRSPIDIVIHSQASCFQKRPLTPPNP